MHGAAAARVQQAAYLACSHSKLVLLLQSVHRQTHVHRGMCAICLEQTCIMLGKSTKWALQIVHAKALCLAFHQELGRALNYLHSLRPAHERVSMCCYGPWLSQDTCCSSDQQWQARLKTQVAELLSWLQTRLQLTLQASGIHPHGQV